MNLWHLVPNTYPATGRERDNSFHHIIPFVTFSEIINTLVLRVWIPKHIVENPCDGLGEKVIFHTYWKDKYASIFSLEGSVI